MGYTHYWDRPQLIDSTTFNAIRQGFLGALPPLATTGAPLGDLYSVKSRSSTADLIGGHARNLDVRIPLEH